MTGKRFIWMIMIAMLLGTASCASKCFTTTLVPVDDSRTCVPVRFRIESITPLPAEEFFITGYTDSCYWSEKIKNSGCMNELTADLQERAGDLYPDLFTCDSAALPLHISVSSHHFHNRCAASSFMAAISWGLFGMVLPLPLDFTCDYVVSIACPDVAITEETAFENHLVSWISFPSPLALIPIPGCADRRASVLYPYQSTYYTGKDFTLDCLVEATVQALYKTDGKILLKAYTERCRSVAKTNARPVSLRE